MTANVIGGKKKEIVSTEQKKLLIVLYLYLFLYRLHLNTIKWKSLNL